MKVFQLRSYFVLLVALYQQVHVDIEGIEGAVLAILDCLLRIYEPHFVEVYNHFGLLGHENCKNYP